LVLAQQLLKVTSSLIFDASLHLGTVVVILIIYRRDIANIVECLLKGDLKSEDTRLGLLLVVGTIPTMIIGLTFQRIFEASFYRLEVAALGFIVTGFILYLTKSRKGEKPLSFTDSILIGAAQGVAILPGISRSGSTISVGIFRNVKAETAIKYSFLLSVPAIIGATIIETKDFRMVSLPLILIGVLSSMIVGYVSYKILIRLIKNQNFHRFAYYCWAVGTITLVTALLKVTP